MTIEETDFKMVSDTGDLLWDLYFLKTIGKAPKSKAKENDKPREGFVIQGYGMPFDHCLKKIAKFRVEKNQPTSDLYNYLNQYKKELENLYKNVGKY